MRYETVKSILLTLLVLLSIGLTWSLWSYQPNLDPLVSGKFVEEVKMGEKKEDSKIIKPDRILYHIEGKHFGTSRINELDRLMKEMSGWVFFDVKNHTEQAGTFKQAVHGNGKVEIVFPHEVPIEVFRNILSFEEKRLPSFQFDRIVIDMKSLQKDRGIVYFANVKNQEIYISYISASLLDRFNRSFYERASKNSTYFAFNATEKRVIFLPEEETEMWAYKYLPKSLDSEDFKEALFTNPSLVQKSLVSTGEEFANDSSKMNIYSNKNLLVFINPAEDNGYLSGSTNLLRRSIDFINEHYGWTDPYRFVYLDESSQRVTFRLYSMDGYPIFNEDGLSEITEIWGRNEITKLTRPTFAMELPLETTKMIRPSGREVLEILQKQRGFKPELLENLVLGYKMDRDSASNRLITLEPAWFYLYNKKWAQIALDEFGGLRHGLE
ncbi:YycH family regulatory protein [Bacillus sp. FJAT-27445]|uniref:YycH family regulatory protein n=1 Tax=Bacillus sp. FJAT-27445 TaxID=1679166 RepID=UPI00074371AD|nr:two-component system activity regulator YycH [Bacillus sp. FJAT-27445]